MAQQPLSMDDIYNFVDWMNAGDLDDGTNSNGD